MAMAVRIGVIGLVLSATSALSADFNAELDFVTRASTANLFAIAESRLAIDRSGASDVKAFARQLVDDHASAETALGVAAEGSGATLAKDLDPSDQARLAALQKKSGTDFDKAFLADQGEVHSNALTLYADYMLLGDNEKLKALAIKMIPIDEAQLKRVQAMSGD